MEGLIVRLKCSKVTRNTSCSSRNFLFSHYLCTMSFPLFLARRLFGSQQAQRISRPAIRVAMAGVAVGVAVMIVSVSVITGFKHAVRDKVSGFGSHITLTNALSVRTGEALALRADDSLLTVASGWEAVTHAQRVSLVQGVLKTEDDFLGVGFQGVDQSYDTTFLSQCLMEGSIPAFSDSVSSGGVVLSKEMAEKLRLKKGDRVFAYFISSAGLRPRRFRVDAIYATNVRFFDQSVCFIDRYTANRLNGWERDDVSRVEMRISDFDHVARHWESISKQQEGNTDSEGNPLFFYTIEQQYPQVFSWLGLLDVNVWVILALMIALSAFTMISGLLIIILERTQMIGLLKALGSRDVLIRQTFLWLAALVVGKGVVIGNVIAVVLCLVQQLTYIVRLNPASYYIDYVPIELNVGYLLLINAATLAICVSVLILPSVLVSRIRPARTIRF